MSKNTETLNTTNQTSETGRSASREKKWLRTGAIAALALICSCTSSSGGEQLPVSTVEPTILRAAPAQQIRKLLPPLPRAATIPEDPYISRGIDRDPQRCSDHVWNMLQLDVRMSGVATSPLVRITSVCEVDNQVEGYFDGENVFEVRHFHAVLSVTRKACDLVITTSWTNAGPYESDLTEVFGRGSTVATPTGAKPQDEMSNFLWPRGPEEVDEALAFAVQGTPAQAVLAACNK